MRQLAVSQRPAPAGRPLIVQRAAISSAPVPDVPPIVHDVLRSPGQPLDEDTCAAMEPHFGHDFSRVRVHTDVHAAESARAVRARAYTVGRDVVFGAGQYAPGTPAGQRLLTHELTHVIQRPGPTPAPTVVAELDSPQEREAAGAEGGLAQIVRVPLVARAVPAGGARLWRTPSDLTGAARIRRPPSVGRFRRY